ncbi:hypothetical protein TNCV_1863021 [Trichonephila clavipes]|nr:hypothetical protein TNCV_1863021 [Trichonephila clavipes]
MWVCESSVVHILTVRQHTAPITGGVVWDTLSGNTWLLLILKDGDVAAPRRGQVSVPANLPDQPVQSIDLDAISNEIRTSVLKCAGAPSSWNHIRAFMLAGTLFSRTLQPYMQLAPYS